MKYIKIVNLIDNGGIADYKGLDINMIVPGSQEYTQNHAQCILATKQAIVKSHIDITELTEVEYQAEKKFFLDGLPKSKSVEDMSADIELLQAENAELKQAVLDLTELVLGV